jgi:hypothetical protein
MDGLGLKVFLCRIVGSTRDFRNRETFWKRFRWLPPFLLWPALFYPKTSIDGVFDGRKPLTHGRDFSGQMPVFIDMSEVSLSQHVGADWST